MSKSGSLKTVSRLWSVSRSSLRACPRKYLGCSTACLENCQETGGRLVKKAYGRRQDAVPSKKGSCLTKPRALAESASTTVVCTKREERGPEFSLATLCCPSRSWYRRVEVLQDFAHLSRSSANPCLSLCQTKPKGLDELSLFQARLSLKSTSLRRRLQSLDFVSPAKPVLRVLTLLANHPLPVKGL